MDITSKFISYYKAKSDTEKLQKKDAMRYTLLSNAQLLKIILILKSNFDSLDSKQIKNNSSMKQDLTKAEHEKKLMEEKIQLLISDVETWKKKGSMQSAIQKENRALKNQVSKLNDELLQSKNEILKAKQQFMTQKAVLESKLENAKKSIRNLKESKTSPLKQPPPSLISPIKLNQKKPANGIILKKPLVSNFSVSPFLAKTTKSPTKETSSSSSSAPNVQNVSTPLNNNIIAQSTPGTALISPLKNLTAKSRRGPSGLKNLLSPERNLNNPKKKITSLFDDAEEEEEKDDIFSNSIRKTKEQKEEAAASLNKRKKRKIGGKAIVEEEDVEEDLNTNRFSPLKRVKLMDKLGGISPLKMRNKERNLFKV